MTTITKKISTLTYALLCLLLLTNFSNDLKAAGTEKNYLTADSTVAPANPPSNIHTIDISHLVFKI